jgi:hypothetical protein
MAEQNKRLTKIVVIKNLPSEQLTNLPNKINEFTKDLKNPNIVSSDLVLVPIITYTYTNIVYIEYDPDQEGASDV